MYKARKDKSTITFLDESTESFAYVKKVFESCTTLEHYKTYENWVTRLCETNKLFNWYYKNTSFYAKQMKLVETVNKQTEQEELLAITCGTCNVDIRKGPCEHMELSKDCKSVIVPITPHKISVTEAGFVTISEM